MQDFALSEYGRASTRPAPVSRMMASFADDFRDGVDINLGVGYVNEKTIPSAEILNAVREVITHPGDYRQALNYGGPEGSPSLIASLRRYYSENRVGGLDSAQLEGIRFVAGANGATSLLESLARVFDPGIVISSDPVYYIYSDFLERSGFEIAAVPEDDDGIVIESLERRIRELGARRQELRFIYLVTVSNPTCSILSNDRRRQLVKLAGRLSAELGRRIPLILDKAYEDLVHDPDREKPLSALHWDQEGLVYELGTLSKILAPALRIGYMMGRDSDLMRAMVQRVSDIGFSAPLLNQEVAGYLLEHHVAGQIAKVNAGYREKAKMVKAMIEDQLGKHLEHVVGGSAGFYFYLTFSRIRTCEGSDFFNFLARTTGDESVDGPAGARKPRVIYIPGEICVHPRGELVKAGRRQLRISYGFEDTDTIGKAIGMMARAADYANRRC